MEGKVIRLQFGEKRDPEREILIGEAVQAVITELTYKVDGDGDEDTASFEEGVVRLESEAATCLALLTPIEQEIALRRASTTLGDKTVEEIEEALGIDRDPPPIAS